MQFLAGKASQMGIEMMIIVELLRTARHHSRTGEGSASKCGISAFTNPGWQLTRHGFELFDLFCW